MNSLRSLLQASYWDTFDRYQWDYMGHRSDHISGSKLESLFKSLWLYYFKKPTDTIPRYFYDENNGLGILRNYFFSAKWFEVYDFIEFIVDYGPKQQKDKFISACNIFLERENSAYRFVSEKITEISSSEEIKEI